MTQIKGTPTKRKKQHSQQSGCLRAVKKFFLTVLFVIALVLVVPFVINGVVCISTKGQIQPISKVEQAASSSQVQAIVVLGAGINYDGSPSPVLQDRLDTAIDLYNAGVAPKIIMTGDNTSASYNEVMAMANYAAAQGVSEDDIFCDHAGVSTYDSMYRLRHVFGVENCVVVTQEYHLYRTLYNARDFGIDAIGVKSDLREYTNIDFYEQREFLARVKDFFQCLINAEPELKSEPVSLYQSGTITQWW